MFLSLVSLIIAVGLFGCAVQLAEPVNVVENQVAVPPVDGQSSDSEVSAEPVAGSDSNLGVSETAFSDGEMVIAGDEPAVSDEVLAGPAAITEGTVALFYRASFGTDTKNLKTVMTDARGNGNLGIADISWDSGSKGIVRYIPETGQTDVIKTIRSTSYSKSSIYPLTVGDRLYAIRDWGSEWAMDNKRFTVEELDPYTGATRSSTDITGEWFTFLNDQVFFQSAITEDFWSGRKGGGKLRVKALGAFDERDLTVEDVRLHSVGDRLVSVGQQEIRWHDPATGEVQSTSYVDTLATENIWPDSRHIFFGDKSVLWGWSGSGSPRINITRAPIDGEPEELIIFDIEDQLTGLVVDEHEGMVLVGFASSVPPKGIGITRIFLIDTSTDGFTKLPVEQHIPSAKLDAGGGLQLLVMP